MNTITQDIQQSPNSIQTTSPPSEFKTRRPSLLKIVGFLAVFILIGSGGFYYLVFYQPAQYAKAIIRFHQENQSLNQISSQTRLKGPDDYKAALQNFQMLEAFFLGRREEFSKIQGPLFGDLRQLYKDYDEIFKAFDKSRSQIKKRLEFMAKLVELRDTMEPKNPPFSPQSAIVKDAQIFLEKQIVKAKQIGQEAFSQEPPQLREVSFDELKIAWEKTEPSLDVFIQFLRSQDPNTPLASFRPDESQFKGAKNATEQIQSFTKLLKAAIDNNTASDILNNRYYGGDEQARMEIRGRRIEETIRKLQQNHGNN